MSLRLLIDEDTQARVLVAQLRAAGHDVLTAGEAGLEAKTDADVLAYARTEQRLLLTRNGADFQALHEDDPVHPGILVIYQDHDPKKNLTYPAIVQAIANLEASGWEMAGQFIALNAWR